MINPEVSTQQLLEDHSRLQVEVEEFLNEASLHGGVIIGRSANFVLRDTPGVLCVLLVGITIVLFLIFQRYYVRGIATTGLKG